MTWHQPGPGRPPLPKAERRDRKWLLNVYLLAAEMDALRSVAEKESMPMSVWVRSVVMRAIRERGHQPK